MNKKLFGTLLLGSLLLGGTFVSCKDYDDDIDNLQSQVDALKSSAALKTDVDGLKSSLEGAISAAQNAATAAKSAADAADKKASEATSELAKKAAQADLEAAQAKLAAAEDKLAKLEAAIAELNGLEAKLTEATAAEFEALKKELNGEFADIKASVEAMLESFNIHSLDLTKGNIIANGDKLHWGVATKDIEWAGPKGNISKGDLLIGLIEKTKGLKVVPATVDLEGANIELVNSAGETAPVSITATPASKSSAGVLVNGTSRAADIQGLWNLAVEPSGVDATTIADAYAVNQGTGKPNNNVLYAISVDGRVLTGYDYMVDVEKAACQDKFTAKQVWDGNYLKLVDTQKMNAGTANVYQVTNSKIYDSYLTFDGNDAERAEDLGITVEGMTVVIPDGLTSRYDLYATLHVIDLTGQITKERGKLVQVDRDEETDIVAAATIKPSIVNNVEIPIGTALKNLSDTDAKQVKEIIVRGTGEKPFVYAKSTNDPTTDNTVVNVGYLNSYGEPINATVGSSSFDVRTVRTLVIKPASNPLNKDAVAGADTLKIDLMGNSKDIIKTIYVPVNVVKPTGAELAEEIKVASAWDDDKLKLTYNNKEIVEKQQIFAYNDHLKECCISYPVTGGVVDVVNNSLSYINLGNDANANDTVGIATAIDYTYLTNIYTYVSGNSGPKEWKIKTGTATFKLANVAAWTFTYNFDIEMVDAFANYQAVWVKKGDNNKPATGNKITVTKKNTSNLVELPKYIAAAGGSPMTEGLGLKNGDKYEALSTTVFDANAPLAIYIKNPQHTIAYTSTTPAAAGDYNVDNITITTPAKYIVTEETGAVVELKATNKFGVDRTYTVNVEFK